MIIDNSQFEELREQILNKKVWDKDRFVVFNYEAGTGKSVSAHRFIGEMTKDQSHRVLYVQRFTRDDELNHTVDAINIHAGGEVAVRYTSEDYTGKEANQKKQRAINSQVLCITHKMYSRICMGHHQELIKSRNILIIDEYPDLLEKITIPLDEVCVLWSKSSRYGYPEIMDMATMFKDILDAEDASTLKGEMHFHSFEGLEYDNIKKILLNAIELISNAQYIGVLQKCIQLLNNGGYVHKDGFHTYDDNIDFDFAMLKNNIILDANAGFDYRYEMSEKFIVRKQDKAFEYSNTRFNHIDVNTTKKATSKYVDFAEKVLETIQLEQRKGTLFVTDKANKDELESCILKYYSNVGDTIEEIEEKLECKISVDYFGNIIGVNTYRDYETVIILKTPNYDYLTYVLTNMFYKSKDKQRVESIKVFQHEGIEQLRKTTVAGEIYQAIKRINRDNSRSAEIFVFTDYQEALDIVVQQLPNVRYSKSSMDVGKKRKPYDKSKRSENSKIIEIQKFLIEAIKAGRKKIKKKEIRDHVGITNSANLKKQLKKLERFLWEHNIHDSEKQELIINENPMNYNENHDELKTA